MDLFNLSDKRAIVTGGAGELASAMAEGLVQAGVKTAIIDRTEILDTVARKVGAVAVPGDLTSAEGCKQAFDACMEALGGLDILVNAVGIGARHKAEAFPLDSWQRVLDINLSSFFHMSRLAGEVMLGQGGGRIVNIGSMTCFVAVPDNAAYCASKGAVTMLTKSLANDWSRRGVNVNCIAPGFMDTKLNKGKNDPVEGPATLARIAQGRLGLGKDLVGPLLFLCSEASAYVTGTVLPVDGGFLCG